MSGPVKNRADWPIHAGASETTPSAVSNSEHNNLRRTSLGPGAERDNQASLVQSESWQCRVVNATLRAFGRAAEAATSVIGMSRDRRSELPQNYRIKR